MHPTMGKNENNKFLLLKERTIITNLQRKCTISVVPYKTERKIRLTIRADCFNLKKNRQL